MYLFGHFYDLHVLFLLSCRWNNNNNNFNKDHQRPSFDFFLSVVFILHFKNKFFLCLWWRLLWPLIQYEVGKKNMYRFLLINVRLHRLTAELYFFFSCCRLLISAIAAAAIMSLSATVHLMSFSFPFECIKVLGFNVVSNQSFGLSVKFKCPLWKTRWHWCVLILCTSSNGRKNHFIDDLFFLVSSAYSLTRFYSRPWWTNGLLCCWLYFGMFFSLLFLVSWQFLVVSMLIFMLFC